MQVEHFWIQQVLRMGAEKNAAPPAHRRQRTASSRQCSSDPTDPARTPGRHPARFLGQQRERTARPARFLGRLRAGKGAPGPTAAAALASVGGAVDEAASLLAMATSID